MDDEAVPTVSTVVGDKKIPKRHKVHISRPLYTQKSFDQRYERDLRKRDSIVERCRHMCLDCSCTAQCWLKCLLRLFPFIAIMRDYQPKRDLLNDFIAGITVGVMHIPQGMAYGLLANLPPVYGLYVSFFPVLIYFFFGTSKHVSLGTFAVISLMVGQIVEKADCSQQLHNSTALHNGNSTNNVSTEAEEKCMLGIALTATMATGLIQIAMGVFHLGFVTIYLSEPLTRGFTTGAAVHVLTSQIKHVFGLSVPRHNGAFKLVYTYIDMFRVIGQTIPAAVITAVVCAILLIVTKELINPKVKPKIKMPVPIELIVVVAATLMSYLLRFEENYSVTIVGDIPTGIPAPTVPSFGNMSDVIADAVSIAIVGFAISVSMAKLFAKKHDYIIDSNQELIAYGLCNSLSSFFNCYVSAVSLSRSLIQESVGGVTQIAGLFSCALLLVVLYLIGPLFEQLPKASLAAIIIVALKGMFLQFKDVPKLWKTDGYDCAVWVTVFFATVFLDVDLGLIVGVAFNLFTVVFRTQRPYTCILGRMPQTDLYKDITVYAAVEEIPGVKIFRFEAALYYANHEHFSTKLYSKTGLNPRKIKLQIQKAEKEAKKRKELDGVKNNMIMGTFGVNVDNPAYDTHSIILDCTTMGYMDSVGVDCLITTIKEFSDINVQVMLAGCKAGVREMFEASHFHRQIKLVLLARDVLYLTIHDAVLAALQNHPETLSEKVPAPAYETEKTASNESGPPLLTEEIN